jgi:hypothetical protein
MTACREVREFTRCADVQLNLDVLPQSLTLEEQAIVEAYGERLKEKFQVKPEQVSHGQAA